jgi:8-oxo-dGTP pyrophosphatase MutT (NUDIX family)
LTDTVQGTEAIERWLSAAPHRVRPEAAPGWMSALVTASAAIEPAELARNDPPARTVGPRQAAVLILLGDGPAGDSATGPEVLLQQRAVGLRNHASEVSFPGGGREPGDASPVETALREAVEETGLDAAGVEPVALLPRLVIPVSGYQVTGVLAYWRRPSLVAAVDRGETHSVARIPLAVLADPDIRLTVRNNTGWHGPAFRLPGMLIWGYTAEVLNAVLRMGQWERPWATEPTEDLDTARRAAGTA